MDYGLEPYYEDQYDDQYSGEMYEDPGYSYDGISDEGDDIVNSSPSPQERINAAPPRYVAQYQSYGDDPRGYQPMPLYNNRDFRTQFPMARQALSRTPFQPQFGASQSNYTQYRDTQAQAPTPGPSHAQAPTLTHSQSQYRAQAQASQSQRSTPYRNPEQAVQYQGYQPQDSQKLALRPVSDLPDMYRGLFKFGVFNAVQSSCFDSVLYSKENMVISAPTGSGKTVLFELAIIKMLSEAQQTGQSVKCVYVAPTKALCSERYRDWASKFDPLGIKCCELTGDTVHVGYGKGAWGDAKSATIMQVLFSFPITTGEKWDSLTRNWDDHDKTLSQIQLFLVDEVHILNETRGSTLEVVVSRMRLRGSAVRFVFVSATVPNIQDIANWIGRDASSGSARVYEFGEEFRPCKLVRHVVSFPRAKSQNDFLFSKNLDYKLFKVLQDYSKGKPILVFVSTRKGVFHTAEQLAKDFNDAAAKRQSLPWTRPGRVDRIFNDKRLIELVSLGIGVHHAGLTTDDRRTVEELFLNKILRIVIATTTLGCRTAHTVVMKGVHTFQNNSSVEYSDLDVMQMLGRAGRPQFDKDGMAIIMCESELENKYRALVQGKTVVESSLHTNLSEHINSEIGLGTISNVNSAKEWLKSSFLFQRIQKNPRHYSLGKDDGQTWEDRVDDIVMQSIRNLRKSELITMEEGNDAIASTEYGDIMSKFYIRQKTMALILTIPERATMREILDVIASAEEFSDSRLRASEKSIYNQLRRHNDIRYEVKKVERTSDKILLIIQAVLGGISLSQPEYKSGDSQPHLEAYSVFRHLPRIARAVVEVSIAKRFGAPLKHGLELVRCFTAKAWEDRPVVLRQIESIGEKSLKVLAEHGITSVPTLRKQDSLRLEMLLNRKPPFVHSDGGRTPVDVELSIECGLAEETGPTKAKKQKSRFTHMTSVLTLTSDNVFVDFRRISTKALRELKTFEVCATLDKPSQSLIVFISSESYAGVTVTETHRPKVPPSEYPMPNTKPMTALEMELQDLEEMDPADLADIPMDKYGNEIEDLEPVRFKDLRKSNVNKPAPPPPREPDSPPAPKRLPTGKYDCREGLSDPPKTKASAAAKSNRNEIQKQSSLNFSATKRSPKTKPKKSHVKTLDDLENLHQSTNVQKNLNMPKGHRIKLQPSPNVVSKRKKGPPPNFDIEFSTIASADTGHRDVPAFLDDDDELPAASEIFSSTKKRTQPSDDNYSNSEVDALICDLPSDDLLFGASIPKGIGQSEGPVKKRAKHDKEELGSLRTNSRKTTSASAMIRREVPLFLADKDDKDVFPQANVDSDDEVEFVDGPIPADDNDDFALDSQYYDATPDLTMSTHSFEDEEYELDDAPMAYTPESKHAALAYLSEAEPQEKMSGLVQGPLKIVEPDGMQVDDDEEFALLEAWLDQNTVAE
ncbi:P-loop containing nucleoside triphosphate hydrolase protein [Gymnopus androsaceus JB14]|uniref:DNA 3'-5' helicase n=1 Tax=Gymnopus androsaceus JB14 TaxID=1447944 RepID=A0A6A4H8Z4_9AGAR|nr:P-loop containing nucleoside triphosphate hydrolase protein [Gymnopus androsaceus JB14]